MKRKKNKKILIRHLFTPEELKLLSENIKGNEVGLMMVLRTANLSQSKRINLIVNELNIPEFHHIFDGKKLYWYSENKYLEINIESIQHLTKKLFVLCSWSDYRTHAGNEVYNQLVADSQIPIDEINNYDEIVPYNNGLFDLNTMTFLGPNPDFFFTYYLTVDYVNSDNCPKFKAFIEEILPYEKPRIQILTYLAYSFTNRIDIEMTQFWTGAGNNGKSTLADIISFIMNDSVSHVERKRLLNPNDRFSRAFLKNKLINFCSEVSSKHKMDAESVAGFKRLTDRFQHGENKGIDQMEWENTAKIIFLMNDLPLATAHCDYAYFRRIEIIPFTVIVPPERIIKELSSILFKEEGSQITAYILSHYPLIDTILKQDAVLAEDLWIRNTNTVFQFVSFFCEISPLYQNDIGPIHDNYCDWCKKIKKKPVKLQTFTHITESHGVQRKQERHYENGNVITTHGIECNRDGSSDNYPKQQKITPESPKPFKFPEVIKFKGFEDPLKAQKLSKSADKILEQIKLLQKNYEKDTYFDDDDIYEPLATQISQEEFQMGKLKLFKSGLIEMIEIGTRLK